MPNYSPGVSIITCTGDRPQAFALCKRFVERQAYDGRLQWIRVIDGVDNGCSPGSGVISALGAEGCNRTITDVRFPPQPGKNTLARNLLAAIPQVQRQNVLFIEDDDFYASDYVARIAALLDQASIVGDPNSLYYHLPSHRYRVMRNEGTASLCQTGIRAELLPYLAKVCQDGPDFIDGRLWQMAQRRYLGPIGGVVGIKGLPGRPGIGVGHRPDSRPGEWSDDADLSKLREWVGEDIELYREFL